MGIYFYRPLDRNISDFLSLTYSNDPNTKKAWKVAFSALQDSCNAGDLSIQEAFYKFNAVEK